ncbi:MAG: SEC-C metal-binding domain-containing protein [Pseudonocardiaceae bacterium]
MDYSHGSVISGWLHPSHQLADDDLCPCGAGIIYGACHGQNLDD